MRRSRHIGPFGCRYRPDVNKINARAQMIKAKVPLSQVLDGEVHTSEEALEVAEKLAIQSCSKLLLVAAVRASARLKAE